MSNIDKIEVVFPERMSLIEIFPDLAQERISSGTSLLDVIEKFIPDISRHPALSYDCALSPENNLKNDFIGVNGLASKHLDDKLINPASNKETSSTLSDARTIACSPVALSTANDVNLVIAGIRHTAFLQYKQKLGL